MDFYGFSGLLRHILEPERTHKENNVSASLYNPATGFDIGDPDLIPLDASNLPSREEVAEAAAPLILSASGWRKVFASPLPGDETAPWSGGAGAEDSLTTRISAADAVIAVFMAKAFGDFIVGQDSGRGSLSPSVLLGIDTRPTGPAIADIFARVLLGMGIGVRYCFIISAPEIMALAGKAGRLPPGDPLRIAGFAYISASHNPPGHNGVKFGLGTGGVLGAAQIAPLINAFRASIGSATPSSDALALVSAPGRELIASCYRECGQWKRQAVSAYTLFTHEVLTGVADLEGQAACLDELAQSCAKRPLGIVAELNGSARTLSIDRDFLEGLSVRGKFFNDAPRKFVRRIVPEGESLSLCMRLLAEARAKDPSYQLGYAPDCDGDRGNLVFFDKTGGAARILEAQEVFSLSCLSELAGLYRGSAPAKVAVVVNDATSMRIEKIAGFFGAAVFRAETGEANVVSLADELRRDGWTVRILGEGSNGGTITHPSRVRDPLSTLGAMIRLLRLPDTQASPGLFRLWLKALGRESEYSDDYDLADVIATLPRWATTSVFEERAALRVKTADKKLLKTRYGAVFALEWERKKAELLRAYDIWTWKALATNGISEKEVGKDFASSGSGGLRIVFSGRDGEAKAFLWMRGSGTEPVFRIMADVEGGGPDDEEFFLSWHTAMVRAADG